MRRRGDRQDRGPEPTWRDYLFFITLAVAVVLFNAVVAALLLTWFDLWGAFGGAHTPDGIPPFPRLVGAPDLPGGGPADFAGAGPTR